MTPLLHVALHEPEIPNNTGNIGRTCVALGCALHLIHPLGFDVSEKACRRAGLDYWSRLDVREHRSLEDYLASNTSARLWVLTTRATRPVWDGDIRAGDHLLFGKETRGLPPEILDRFSDRLLTLPMLAAERSLNLATAVCTVAYEGVRQMVGRGEVRIDPRGRLQTPAAI
ncbi:MAG: tRNA (cytidine(34)-2'-O)-methyltransferase [Phycisphaerales bacterium]|nr:tRNA (cytidine(34)-2'-O)-methyltransferase [Phycisphaerales bacterium]